MNLSTGGMSQVAMISISCSCSTFQAPGFAAPPGERLLLKPALELRPPLKESLALSLLLDLDLADWPVSEVSLEDSLEIGVWGIVGDWSEVWVVVEFTCRKWLDRIDSQVIQLSGRAITWQHESTCVGTWLKLDIKKWMVIYAQLYIMCYIPISKN